jgi:hypothetical protein
MNGRGYEGLSKQKVDMSDFKEKKKDLLPASVFWLLTCK